MTPLMVGLATTLEPVVGQVIGWALGVMVPPGIFTYCGGAAVLAGTAVVTAATAAREAVERERTAGAAVLAGVFGDQDMELVGGGAQADALEARGLLHSDSEGDGQNDRTELYSMGWEPDDSRDGARGGTPRGAL